MDNKAKIVLDAVDNTKVAFASVKSNLDGLSTAAGTLNGTLARLAPVLGAASFTAFVKGGIDAADSLNDLHDRTGAAVESLAGLQLVATQSDTSLEALGKGLNKVTLFMAENGKRAKELGITAKDPEQAFAQLATTLARVEDAGKRNSIANEVLGKGYAELLPSLLQGGDALAEQIRRGKELNPVTGEMAKQAAEFNDKLDELKIAGSGFGVTVAKDMLPALNDLILKMQSAYKESGLLTSMWVGWGTIWKNAVFGSDAENEIKRATVGIPAQIVELQTKLQNDINKSKPLSFIDRKQIELDIQYLAKESNNLLKKHGLIKPEEEHKKTTGESPDIKTTETTHKKTGEDRIREQIAQLQTVNNLVALGVSLEDARTIARERQNGATESSIAKLLDQQNLQRTVDEEQKAAQKQMEERAKVQAEWQTNATKAQADNATMLYEYEQEGLKTKEKINAELDKQIEDMQFQATLEGLSTEEKAKQNALRIAALEYEQALHELNQAGVYLDEEESAALKAKYDKLAQVNGKLKEGNSISKDIGLTFKSALEDAIVSGEKFSDVLKSIGQDIERMLVRRTITEPLMNGIDGLLGDVDWGGLFDGVFSANGNAFAGNGVVPFANGGAFGNGEILTQPTFFKFKDGGQFRNGVAGEAGDEAALPLKRLGNGKLGVHADIAGNGGTNVVVNIIGAPSQPKVEQRDDGNGNMRMNIIFDAIKADLSKDIRSEGVFAQTLQGQYGLNRASGGR